MRLGNVFGCGYCDIPVLRRQVVKILQMKIQGRQRSRGVRAKRRYAIALGWAARTGDDWVGKCVAVYSSIIRL